MKIKIEIKHWVTGAVLFEFEKENNTIKDTICEANLRGADLREADLREANLYEANLYGANLRGANLYEADLREANLYGANLYEANLSEADLYGANLRGADLREANLYEANLYGANLRGANLYEADLSEADLREADLYGANLRGADLKNLPQDFINQCSRDILFILGCLKSEVPHLREKLVAGEIDGSQYEGECSCLIGSLAQTNGDIKKTCEAIPFYQKGTHNYGEMWFLNIEKGDTPDNNQFAAHALKLIDMVLTTPPLL